MNTVHTMQGFRLVLHLFITFHYFFFHSAVTSNSLPPPPPPLSRGSHLFAIYPYSLTFQCFSTRVYFSCRIILLPSTRRCPLFLFGRMLVLFCFYCHRIDLFIVVLIYTRAHQHTHTHQFKPNGLFSVICNSFNSGFFILAVLFREFV